ncbi:MAG: glutamate-5-semialdehyde dehydrogenase [Dehalococcoidia bacterium]|nr:MAG: glutamate-5-semialdehyde dehydrogenase [Dehalococcoidia bacterium]
MKSAIEELEGKARAAKAASRRMAYLSAEVKNKALHNISDDLLAKKDEILAANQLDYHESHVSGMSPAMLDRLMLSPERLEAIAQDVLAVAALPDPVGEVFDMRTLPNGLQIGRKRVPLGVIGAIYESRPNVTIDISALCLKSGNAIILRGGKEAIHSNSALAGVVQEAATRAGVPDGAVQFVENTDRALVNHLLKMGDIIALLIPRGGAGLIKFVTENATMPVVSGGVGVCHTYVDRSADVAKAVAIAVNAKVQRPTVCNALDTLLVHVDVAERYLPLVAAEWAKAGVEMHCDERALSILKSYPSLKLVAATDKDWGKEFLSLVAAIKVVNSLDEALEHIEGYGSGHSEAILTEEYQAAMRFLNEVDAACVYVNASTRFTDGGQFGLGAEVGISTQKFHARGPLGVKELTSYKWIIFGSGQVRP